VRDNTAKEINKLNRQKADLLVLIDTLQTNMRSIVSYLDENQKKQISTPSFKWVMNWNASHLDE